MKLAFWVPLNCTESSQFFWLMMLWIFYVSFVYDPWAHASVKSCIIDTLALAVSVPPLYWLPFCAPWGRVFTYSHLRGSSFQRKAGCASFHHSELITVYRKYSFLLPSLTLECVMQNVEKNFLQELLTNKIDLQRGHRLWIVNCSKWCGKR